MRLKRDDMLSLLSLEGYLRKSLIRDGGRIEDLSEAARDSLSDLDVSREIVMRAETIIFPSEVMLDLLSNIDRIQCTGDLYLPYPHIIVQFTSSIPEAQIMRHVEINDWQTEFGQTEDFVDAVILSNPEQDPRVVAQKLEGVRRNCAVWFKSTSMNRVSWTVDSNVEDAVIRYIKSRPGKFTQAQRENKERLLKIAYLLNLFFNAPNVTIQRQRPDPKVQKHRERKGKRLLPEYHIVNIDKTVIKYSEAGSGKGTSHSRMYPVRGHFRRLHNSTEKIWIPNHFRGLRHGTDSLRKEVYKAKPLPPDPS